MKNNKSFSLVEYWKYATLEELHQHSSMWLSEIAFWKEELFFMQKLVSNHFVYFTDKKHLKETFSLTDEIKALEAMRAGVEEKVAEHEKYLKGVLELHSKNQEKDYRTEHGVLQREITGFISKYKKAKKALFQEADEVLKEEKVKRLISHIE